MYKRFVYSIFCIFLFPSIVFSQEYTVVWGEETLYQTKNDAVNAMFLRAVTDTVAQMLNLSPNSTRYNAYQAFFSNSFLEYIQEYTEKDNTVFTDKNVTDATEKKTVLYPVAMNILVNTKKIRSVLEELGALRLTSSPVKYSIVFDKDTPASEKDYIKKQLYILETISNVHNSQNAAIQLKLWKDKLGTYSGILLFGKHHYTTTASSVAIVWRKLWATYWKMNNSVASENTELTTKTYRLEVQKVQTTQGVASLDEAFTLKLSDAVEEMTLSDIVSTGETFTAIWVCTVYNEAEFITIIRSILSLYPTVTYKISIDKSLMRENNTQNLMK